MSGIPRSHYRAGQGMTLAATAMGDAIAAAPSRRFKHPWFTTPAWSPQAKRWVATINPGFVNEETPIYRATVEEQKTLGNPWHVNPLTGQKFFSARVFAQPAASVSATPLDIPLYLHPAIPLDVRSLGFDGDPNTSVPEYFLQKGVAKAVRQPSAGDQLQGAKPVDATPPANLRLLRACDLWVHQPRLGLTSTFAAGGLGGAPFVQQLTVASPAASDALRVFQGTFTPYTAFRAGVDPLEADYTEPTYDELLISTVYLLSPPNTPLGSVPDQTWQPFVRHNLFWNLQWAQPPFRQPAADAGQITFPPLAAGAGSLLISIMQSLLADARQTAANILAGTTLAGHFWTATGGGSSAQYSVDSNQSAPRLGPNRRDNRAAQIAARQAQQRKVQLDPDFPYTVRQFPTALLTA